MDRLMAFQKMKRRGSIQDLDPNYRKSVSGMKSRNKDDEDGLVAGQEAPELVASAPCSVPKESKSVKEISPKPQESPQAQPGPGHHPEAQETPKDKPETPKQVVIDVAPPGHDNGQNSSESDLDNGNGKDRDSESEVGIHHYVDSESEKKNKQKKGWGCCCVFMIILLLGLSSVEAYNYKESSWSLTRWCMKRYTAYRTIIAENMARKRLMTEEEISKQKPPEECRVCTQKRYNMNNDTGTLEDLCEMHYKMQFCKNTVCRKPHDRWPTINYCEDCYPCHQCKTIKYTPIDEDKQGGAEHKENDCLVTFQTDRGGQKHELLCSKCVQTFNLDLYISASATGKIPIKQEGNWAERDPKVLGNLIWNGENSSWGSEYYNGIGIQISQLGSRPEKIDGGVFGGESIPGNEDWLLLRTITTEGGGIRALTGGLGILSVHTAWEQNKSWASKFSYYDDGNAWAKTRYVFQTKTGPNDRITLCYLFDELDPHWAIIESANGHILYRSPTSDNRIHPPENGIWKRELI